MMWTAILVTAVGCYLMKLAGLSVPPKVLDHPVVERVADLVPVALLSALIAVQVFASGPQLQVDARVAGLGAALLALLLRAPFIVVVATAAVVAALVRLAAASRPRKGSRPTVRPGREAISRTASSTPGMNEARS